MFAQLFPSTSCRCRPITSFLPAPTSEDRGDTGHFPTAIAAAFHLARTLAVHLALVPAEAKRGQGKVDLGAGALLFWAERGVRRSGWRKMQGHEHSPTA